MSIINLSSPNCPSVAGARCRALRVGGDWRHAVRDLRVAIEDAVPRAKRGVPRFTADRVGMMVLDHIGELNSRALPILQVVIAELVRQSRK